MAASGDDVQDVLVALATAVTCGTASDVTSTLPVGLPVRQPQGICHLPCDAQF